MYENSCEITKNGLQLAELVEPEVGEPVGIELPGGMTVRGTWLGRVSNGRELAEVMRLMWAIAAEREAQEADLARVQ